MTTPRALNLNDLVDATTRAQRRAADPTASAWVSANAGTGKTHVLTSRVLRLLLAGTKPERILCLTFTKAAAAEMSTRVFDRLAKWAGAPQATLHTALAELLGRDPTPVETARARALFALAIETPGGLKVQTIHAFCERLLQRFPLEAGVPPGFTILDDEHKQTLMREAIDHALDAAAGSVGSPLHAALQTVVVHAVDERFDQLLAAMIAERDWSDAVPPTMPLGKESFAEAEASCRAALGIAKGATLDGVSRDISELLSANDMRRVIEALDGGSANDTNAADRLRPALRPSNVGALIDALGSFFLTGTGQPRKSLMTNATAARHPDLAALLTRAQGHFVDLDQQRRALTAADATLALLRLADVARTDYAARKARRAALDYDDLIVKAAALLFGQGHDPAGAAQWVHYKLDEGLDHILVDEAQDTSPMQWRVIRGLAEEFFGDTAGRDSATGARTVFAVGDEKQSIYGFQGAAPHMLGEIGTHFAGHARVASHTWNDVSLTLSFRTTTPVLEAVDAVFADPARTPGVAREPGALRHESSRQGHAGLVEIWDTELFEATIDADTFMPTGERTAPSTTVRLAGRIADTIKNWLKTDAERLGSEDRPIRAGDILILVRRRASFAPAMIAALKQRGIPVSGADRMQLDDQIAVRDLIAVGDILLLPEDDLALACVLKSPLIGLDDDDLMRVAPNRPGALWTALLDAARKGDARLATAAETIKRWRNRADFMPPFEFYAELLDAEGGRAKLLARLGAEAADAIDEFLNLALVYDEDAPPSLQGFLDSLRRRQRVIKRDLEHGGNQVRVMTVHGAKGLEAPIVFLPDTCSNRSGGAQGGLVTLPRAGLHQTRASVAPVVWPVKGTADVAAIASAKSEKKRQESHERDRLLYVAMTRARDRLYVCGFEGKRGRDSGCWYDQVQDGLAGRLEVGTDADGRTIRRLSKPQREPAVVRKDEAGLDAAPQPLPVWASRRAPREPGIAIPLTPSRLAPLDVDGDGEPVEVPPSPLDSPRRPAPPGTTVGGPNRFLRGTLTHALLQHLPTFAPERWEQAAAAFVKERGGVLPPRVRTSIVTETLAVLRDPTFSAVFGAGSRAEVAIVAEIPPPGGKGALLRIAGQIDRLVQVDGGVLIVDYKTNRPPPRDAAEVPRAYILQLAGYRMAVQRVFGGVPVRAALLWTEGPGIMELTADVLDSASTELFTLS
jgi:ATP-dependent helicase/nuclease subunit A